jgi:hypothetical protein
MPVHAAPNRPAQILVRGADLGGGGVGPGRHPAAEEQALSIPVEETKVPGTSVQVDAPGKLVGRWVDAPEVPTSLGCRWFPGTSRPSWWAEAGTSISIKGLEPTASSVRCAPASGSV